MNNTFCSKCHRIPSQCCCSPAKKVTEEEILEVLKSIDDATQKLSQGIQEYTIEFDTSGASSVFGRLLRLVTFPVKYVLFGKASI